MKARNAVQIGGDPIDVDGISGGQLRPRLRRAGRKQKQNRQQDGSEEGASRAGRRDGMIVSQAVCSVTKIARASVRSAARLQQIRLARVSTLFGS
jgi:hypothetical protein